MKGILIGNTDALSTADQEALRAAGISAPHRRIRHAGIVAGALWAVLKLFHARRRTRAIWTVAVMGLYCTLVGCTPSTRADAAWYFAPDLTGRRGGCAHPAGRGILGYSDLQPFRYFYPEAFNSPLPRRQDSSPWPGPWSGRLLSCRVGQPPPWPCRWRPNWHPARGAGALSRATGILAGLQYHRRAIRHGTVAGGPGGTAAGAGLPCAGGLHGDVVAYLAGWLLDGARWVADIPGSMVHLPPLSPLWITGLALLLILCGGV